MQVLSCDTEILSLVLHPVILWCSARAKSLWMGFNSSFFVFPLGEVMKRVRGMTTVGAAESHFCQTNPDMVLDLGVLAVQLGSLLWCV